MFILASLPYKRPLNGVQFESVGFNSNQRGFSLIELMVAVAIIGILTSIAMPSYINYVKRGKVAEATTDLSTGRVKMEQYFQDNRTYVNGPCPAAGVNFTYACVTTATTYTITATNKASDMAGFSFTINESNAKTSQYDGATGATCWLTSKSGTC